MNKGGRPPKGVDKRDHFFQLRLTADEYKTLQCLAEQAGGTAPWFLRKMIAEHIFEFNNNAGGAIELKYAPDYKIVDSGAHEKTT